LLPEGRLVISLFGENGLQRARFRALAISMLRRPAAGSRSFAGPPPEHDGRETGLSRLERRQLRPRARRGPRMTPL
jgi:hypothetical protein